MKAYRIYEHLKNCNQWRPRAVRIKLADADKRIRELQKTEPNKIFKIEPYELSI
jgi:predicted anti-sigma-YlaC factor YlaD